MLTMKDVETIGTHDRADSRKAFLNEYMFDLLKQICNTQYNIALSNVGRFIPPSFAKEYPYIQTPTMRATYNNYDNKLTIDEIVEKTADNSVMIVGCGGCGKTYALIEFAGKLLDPETITLPFCVPFYIPLNDFNLKTSSIIEYVVTLFCGEYAQNSKNDFENSFMEWLSTEHNEKIIFLLDGLNEITDSDIQIRILEEIKKLQSTYSCVRFVITSRYDLSSSLLSGAVSPFVTYSVNELSTDTVEEYIKEFFKNRRGVHDIIANAMISKRDKSKKEAKDFLRNPMALVMYCFMNCDDGNKFIVPHKDYCTIGELIDNYIFLIKKKNKTSKDSNDTAMKFLRYIGYKMNIDGLFKISIVALKEYADQYNDFDVDKWLEMSFVKDMLKCSANGDILYEIEFVHQNYRDFFAADYLKEILTRGNVKSINICFGERNITPEVQVLLGDILEEYKYTANSNNSSYSVIQDIITRHKNNLIPTAIAQLIRIAAAARKNNLSSFDFSGVDLSSTSLNQIKLYEIGGSKAKFDNATIDKSTFNALGHPGSVSSMLWLEGRYLVSFSKLAVFCFDMKLKKHYQITETSECAIRAAIHLTGTNQIITGNDFGDIILWSYGFEDEKIYLEMCTSQCISNPNVIQDLIQFKGKIYASAKDGGIYSFTVTNDSILDLTPINDPTQLNKYLNPNCKLAASADTLYISYGNTLKKYDVAVGNILISSGERTFKNAEIIDIAVTETENGSDLLLNIRQNEENGNVVSQVLLYSFETNDTYKIIEKDHSVRRVGFKGWNSFSLPYDDKVIYLTANIEDAANVEAGLLKIYYPDYLRENTEYRGVNYGGNNHSMSVNCAVPFCYNKKEYIATGSTERSVDILSDSGIEGTLLYHLIGHDNGIHYMHIVSSDKMYTAHYSGEISEWRYANHKWKCYHVYAPHNNWVWETRCVTTQQGSYVISCSYDNTISVVNTRTEELVCLISEPTSRVLSFGFISDNIILTGYTQKGSYVLRKFAIDYSNKTYTAGSEINLLSNIGAELRAIHTAPDKLLLCVNDNNKGYLFCVGKQNDLSLNEICVKSKYTIEEPDLRINLRCADQIEYNGKTIIACGGDYHDNTGRIGFYICICKEFCNAISYKCEFNGCSTFKLVKYDEKLFIVAGTYDKKVCTYLINEELHTITPTESCIELEDKVLNIQIYEENAYFSLLNGRVYSAKLSDLINNTCFADKLFGSLSGLRCCHTDFSHSTLNWDPDFKELMGYYGRVGQ